MQQAIAWGNVDPDLYRHIMSFGHYESNLEVLKNLVEYSHFEW